MEFIVRVYKSLNSVFNEYPEYPFSINNKMTNLLCYRVVLRCVLLLETVLMLLLSACTIFETNVSKRTVLCCYSRLTIFETNVSKRRYLMLLLGLQLF